MCGYRATASMLLRSHIRTCSVLVGPILWGDSGPLCHVLSLLWTSKHRRRATVATPGEWQCKTGGVQRLTVANGPNIFQMLLVYFVKTSSGTEAHLI